MAVIIGTVKFDLLARYAGGDPQQIGTIEIPVSASPYGAIVEFDPVFLEFETLVETLVAHQRKDSGSCLCGWAELGRSHPKHVAQMVKGAA